MEECPLPEAYLKYRPEVGEKRIWKELEKEVIKGIEKGLDKLCKRYGRKYVFYSLLDTPPEFNEETDFERVWLYIQLKETAEPLLVPAIVYYFTVLGYPPLAVYSMDLVHGVPAYTEGLLGGRDIDYFVVLEKSPEPGIKESEEKLEKYLDYLLGTAITAALVKSKYSPRDKTRFWKYRKPCFEELERAKPFNEIINHNLVEVHIAPGDSEFNPGKLSRDAKLLYMAVDRSSIGEPKIT